MTETDFKKSLTDEIKRRFKKCIVTKLDPSFIQGIPDLLILFGNRWATLECKKDGKAKHRPNQDYYVSQMNEMSFSSFIYPENKEEVLNELEKFFMA